jgi:tryptophan synthase alpha chain
VSATSTAGIFAVAKEQGRAALVGYLPAGFPSRQGAIEAMAAMADAGCDLIEIGLPYSDPVMDGPTVANAAQKALDAGIRTKDVLETVEQVAGSGIPTVVMTYWNPVERYGVSRFAADLASAGGSGLITPDIIPEEAGEWIAAADQHGLDKIFLVAPSSTDERLSLTTAACRGFIYAAAVMGVTGARQKPSLLAEPLVRRTRETTELPIAVGLGVSTAAQAAEVASYADGVIVGSAFIRALELDGIPGLQALVADLAKGVRRA